MKEPETSVNLTLALAKAALKAPEIDLAFFVLTLFNGSWIKAGLQFFKVRPPSMQYISESYIIAILSQLVNKITSNFGKFFLNSSTVFWLSSIW